MEAIMHVSRSCRYNTPISSDMKRSRQTSSKTIKKIRFIQKRTLSDYRHSLKNEARSLKIRPKQLKYLRKIESERKDETCK
jgi:CRISPR/Cas system CSM-associated protein Csm4 (group 5 of RAMP superfamily)